MRAVDVLRGEEVVVAHRLAGALDFQPLLDLIVFAKHKGAIRVAMAMSKDQDSSDFFPSIFRSEPSRRLRQNYHAEE